MALELSLPSFGKSDALLGVDIGTSAVKAVQLVQAGKQYQIAAYAIFPIEKGAIVNGMIEKAPAVTEALEKCLARIAGRVKNVAIAVPTSLVTTKQLQFPENLSDQSIYEQIDADASIHIPYPIDEARFDFCKVGLNPNKTDVDTVLVSMRREQFDERLNAVEAAGCQPTIVDVESYCVQRSVGQAAQTLPKKGKGLVLAHVDMGAVNTTLTVIRDHEILFQRTQPFGGQQLSQSIARQYGMTPDEADLKKRSNELPDDYSSKLLKPFLNEAAQVVERCLQFFYTATPFNRIDQLYLAGGCAPLPGLVDAVIQATKAPAVLFAPQKSYALNSKVNARQLEKDAPSLSIAFGLAMRSFDKHD